MIARSHLLIELPAFWFPAFQLLIELHDTFLIRRPDCLIGRPD
jgi:hypothetical protein